MRRVLAVAALLALTVIMTPGTASAGPYDVTPVLNCVVRNSNGSFTAVLGYHNTTSQTQRVPVGSMNKMSPSPAGVTLPTTFSPGRHNGVFSITLPRYNVVVWQVGWNFLTITENAAAACPPSTQMPGEGNGLGPVVGLGVAGVLGAIVIRRVRRLAETPVSAPAPERVVTDA
jgi:hypothetical protein